MQIQASYLCLLCSCSHCQVPRGPVSTTGHHLKYHWWYLDYWLRNTVLKDSIILSSLTYESSFLLFSGSFPPWSQFSCLHTKDLIGLTKSAAPNSIQFPLHPPSACQPALTDATTPPPPVPLVVNWVGSRMIPQQFLASLLPATAEEAVGILSPNVLQ